MTLLAALLLGQAAGPPARAQNTLRAAAVVNDQVISALELSMRTRLAILAAGFQDSPEVRTRFRQQVLRSLIDERLQLQEAERLEITVSEGQLNDAVEVLAQRNSMTASQFFELLAQNNILPNTLMDQVRGSLTWQAVVQRRLSPSVEVGDDEVDEVVGRIQSSQGQVQVRTAEILLGVDGVAQEAEVRGLAVRLVEQIRKGADFAALAQQFSESATASVGGDMGWTDIGQLPEELRRALADMRPGDLAGPIPTFGGFYILRLEDARRISAGDAEINLKQLLFALPPAPAPEQREEARRGATQARQRLTSCEDVDALAEEVGSPGSGDLGTLKLSDLPASLRRAVASLPIGQPSAPVEVGAGISILMVCSREFDGIDRERIRQSLADQRLDLLARRYLRDLRRAANVDIRL